MEFTNIRFADESFEAIVCNQVPEHVSDDRKALSKLCRAMKTGSRRSIQVPMAGDVTDEDLSIADPKARLHRYGQADHVRVYGRNNLDHLHACGFEVLVIRKEDLLGPPTLERLPVAYEDEVTLVQRTN